MLECRVELEKDIEKIGSESEGHQIDHPKFQVGHPLALPELITQGDYELFERFSFLLPPGMVSTNPGRSGFRTLFSKTLPASRWRFSRSGAPGRASGPRASSGPINSESGAVLEPFLATGAPIHEA